MDRKLNEILMSLLQYGNDVGIPTHITENISKELRPYQKRALEHYLICKNNAKVNRNHLMFNMATGSGKTLIMACLILDLYKRGYNSFIFFVNSNTILEKTKDNFINPSSPKYLFKSDINISGKRVRINAIESISDIRSEDINIHFTTVQALYNRFIEVKENAITLDDLKDKKIVFIADEAHHLNASTRVKKIGEFSGHEEEVEPNTDSEYNWETVIMKAFNNNIENIMLEFTATIPKNNNIIKKYEDKIVFEYTLKEFCREGFSKKIFLMRYEGENLKNRFIGAILLNLYRQLLALKHNIMLKPVILFKSESIALSKANEELFLQMVDELEEDDIKSFYNFIDNKSSVPDLLMNDIFALSKNFFQNEYGELLYSKIVEHIKASFKKEYILNANDESQVIERQIALNTLESDDNRIRVIFAVNKLNEGWDVLNLFDIVRLGNKKATNAITTAETQLIGRGARYYPFGDEERRYQRKFDSSDNELFMIERLTYHSLNDVDFIKQLADSLRESGQEVEIDRQRIKLIPSEKGAKISANNKIYYMSNKREELNSGDIENIRKDNKNKVVELVRSLSIPLLSNLVTESEVSFKELNVSAEKDTQLQDIKNIISFNIFVKACNIYGFFYNDISKLGFNSKKELFEELSKINIKLHSKERLDRETELEIAKYIINHLKENGFIFNNDKQYKGTKFKLEELKNLDNREVLVSKDKGNEEGESEAMFTYEWLYYKNYPAKSVDSEYEKELLKYIESKKNEINTYFSEWIVFRNTGFEEFKLYNLADGRGFEPDFIFFGRRKSNDEIRKELQKPLTIEAFLEVKGEHLAEHDKWKEDFLEEITKESLKAESTEGYLSNLMSKTGLSLVGFPFFTNNNDFQKPFTSFLENKLEDIHNK